jgi:subtilisin family serine protease
MFGIDAGAPCDFSCSHGTYVAGVALGYDAEQPLSGVAPAASLISIQVFSESDPGTPGASESDIIAGLDHVYGLRFSYPIAAVNLSLGGKVFSNAADCDADNGARKAIVDRLRSAGIATVASSGNDGFTDLITAPACISSVIAVGATNSSGAVGSYSNSSDDVDLLAPGSFIRTSTPVDQFRSVTGTSMSTPHVTGAIANILTASPTSSVADILHALEVTGSPVTDERNGVTRPLIDIPAAIEFLLDGGTAGPPEEPTADDPPTTDAPTDNCGLVGLELLAPLLLARAGLRRRRLH